jgi:CRP/FNR family transcriptional regulator, cyclic AMP receptor protein
MLQRNLSHPTPPPSARPESDGGFTLSAWLTNLDFNWDAVSRGSRSRHCPKDDTLFLEGQSASTVYVIVEGRVRLTSFGFDGKERHLMIMGPNGLVGDCGLLSTGNYVVSAVAASDTVVQAIPAARLLAALAQDATLMRQHQELSGRRFRIMLRHLAMQGSNSSRRRVCLHLLDLVNSYGAPHEHGSVISITFTQQEMGNICGLSRVSVSHVFTALERDAVIGRDGRLVVVLDRERLEHFATS